MGNYFCGLAVCDIAVNLWHFAEALLARLVKNTIIGACAEHLRWDFSAHYYYYYYSEGCLYRCALFSSLHLGIYSKLFYGKIDQYRKCRCLFCCITHHTRPYNTFERDTIQEGNVNLLSYNNYYFIEIFCCFQQTGSQVYSPLYHI